MENQILNNPILFVAVFAAAAVFFAVSFAVGHARTMRQKETRLRENGDLAEIVFDCPVVSPSPVGGPLGNPASDVYVLYAVNDRPAQAFGHSVLVPPGSVTLDYEHFLRQAGRKRFAKSFGRIRDTFEVSAGKRYVLSFDYIEQRLEHKAP